MVLFEQVDARADQVRGAKTLCARLLRSQPRRGCAARGRRGIQLLRVALLYDALGAAAARHLGRARGLLRVGCPAQAGGRRAVSARLGAAACVAAPSAGLSHATCSPRLLLAPLGLQLVPRLLGGGHPLGSHRCSGNKPDRQCLAAAGSKRWRCRRRRGVPLFD